jgi:TRAP-type C4-dicarboxylate transport system substrate-binding protein
MLEELGAEPVGMPVPALPQALSKQTVDAGLVPFEVAIPLGLAELTDSSVQLHEGRRFGTSTFIFAMNKERYDALPDDLKQVIDDHSGAALAAEMGTAWNEIEPVGIRIAEEAGNSVVSLSAEATAEFQPAFEAVSERWVEEVSGEGFDAEALLQSAKDAIASHTE